MLQDYSRYNKKNTAISSIKLDHMKFKIFDAFDLQKLQLYVAQSNIISSHSVKIELDLEKRYMVKIRFYSKWPKYYSDLNKKEWHFSLY